MIMTLYSMLAALNTVLAPDLSMKFRQTPHVDGL